MLIIVVILHIFYAFSITFMYSIKDLSIISPHWINDLNLKSFFQKICNSWPMIMSVPPNLREIYKIFGWIVLNIAVFTHAQKWNRFILLNKKEIVPLQMSFFLIQPTNINKNAVVIHFWKVSYISSYYHITAICMNIFLPFLNSKHAVRIEKFK